MSRSARQDASGAPGLYLGATTSGPLIGHPEQGLLVLGPPRSGKTACLVVPNVLAARGPVVSTSTKPDVMAATLAARAERGRCWLYDPSGTVDPPTGVEVLRWSPVASATTWDGAVLMARAMVQAARPGRGLMDASHWTERAEALLAPLLHAAARSGADVGAVMGWVNRRDPEAALEILAAGSAGPASANVPVSTPRASASPGRSTAADVLEGIAATDERELSGIWSTASGVLAAYRLDAALDRSSRPNFDPTGFVAGADTIYVCATGRHQAVVAPLVVGLIEDVRAAVYGRVASSPYRRTSDVPTVLLALDEVANIAPLPDLPSIVSEGGSQGLVTLACLQDLSQGRLRWGDQAEGFGSLFCSTVVLPGIGDVRTLQAISSLCGHVDVRTRADTHGRGGIRRGRSRSVTWATRRQPRFAVDDVAQGRSGGALVIGGPDPPTWVEVAPWWAAEPWRSMAARDGPAAPRRAGAGGPAVARRPGWSHARQAQGRGR